MYFFISGSQYSLECACMCIIIIIPSVSQSIGRQGHSSDFVAVHLRMCTRIIILSVSLSTGRQGYGQDFEWGGGGSCKLHMVASMEGCMIIIYYTPDTGKYHESLALYRHAVTYCTDSIIIILIGL